MTTNDVLAAEPQALKQDGPSCRIARASLWHEAEDFGVAAGPTAIKGATDGELNAFDLPSLTHICRIKARP